MEAFERQSEKKFQGSTSSGSLISITAHIFKLIGDWMMDISSRQMAAATALALAGLVVVLVPQIQKQVPGMSQDNFVPAQPQKLTNTLAKKELSQKPEAVVVEPAADMPQPEPVPMSGAVAKKVAPAVAQPHFLPPSQPGIAHSYMPPQVDYDVSEGGGISYLGSSSMASSAPNAAYAPSAPVMAMKSARIARQREQSTMLSKRIGLQQFGATQIVEELPRLAHGRDDVATVVVDGEERDRFAELELNPVHLTTEKPVSTLSVDVDTASYSFVRRQINAGRLPQPAAVRVEEMLNYFDYDYAAPTDKSRPFKPSVALYTTPWNPETRLLHIGIKGFAATKAVKKSNLVFLIDVSGSMGARDKLPLLKNGLKLLVDSLKPDDTVAIVVYAGAAGTVLEPTPVKERHKIVTALDKLTAGGSTAGGAGIKLAYSLAEANFDKSGVNRVILATDGDFNVGTTDVSALKGLIERKRKSGVFLSVLGFGQGNYNDRLMQELAQNGNGIAAYIDNLNEARKVLVEEATANLFPIARDVKIQVEFNPERISEYRLIGYETRLLGREDFNNDAVDAGDIGAGHTVTAIYEVALADGGGKLVEPLRYGKKIAESKKSSANVGEFAFLKMRYKLPNETKSRLISRAIDDGDLLKGVEALSDDMRFAAAVAAFGQKLRGGKYTGEYSQKDIIALANSGKGADQFGYRAEFIGLVRLAESLK
ncbi:MAG: VWA domain-containing protein [Magnetococcales bacterium]|nr:VWA domain-containing protein [Magnetococcales bacterium]